MSWESQPSPDGPPRWVLVGFAGLAALIGVQSLFADWLQRYLFVADVAEQKTQHGIGYFGGLGIGYAVGFAAAALLVGSQLWRPRRGGAWAALGVGLLVLVDLGAVMWRFHAAQNSAADAVIRLRDSADTVASPLTEFKVSSPGLYAALTATFLLILVAAQLAAPDRSIPVQAVSGAAFSLVACVLPWTWVWLAEGGSDTPYELRTLWPWSVGLDGVMLLVYLAILLVLVVACLRAPGYLRWRWALAVVLPAALAFFGVLAHGADTSSDALSLRNEGFEVLSVSSTEASALFAIGAVLLGLAAVRSWWHGREEIHEPDSAEGWLSTQARHRLDRG
ncbi:MAG TPA: hypothetical protein VHJ83_12925 [Micromonosporaceae bacterium]|nr:hypothetical protein [Micromonosporaceae bacterium]